MQSYEVEIKSLLGSTEAVQSLKDAMKTLDPSTAITSHNRQLNHYFEPSTELGSSDGTLRSLAETVKSHLSDEHNTKLADMAARAKEFSVRTRDKDGIVILVVKASVDDGTSANAVSRMEFEASVPLTLLELDELVLASGFTYQAKWSREREEYLCNGVTVCLDKNAGYGYLAEFERVVDDASKVDAARAEVAKLMETLGVKELPQDRLERMFAFYNAHWPEYYGTDKIFIVE